MKKTLFVPVLAMAAALSVSCSKEETEGVENGPVNGGEAALFAPQSVISASSAATKTALDGVNINWEEGDAITLFGENGASVKYTLTEGAGATVGTFEAEGELPAQVQAYAVYPAVAEGVTLSEDKVAVSVATDQTYNAAGFPAEYPMAAVTSDGQNFLFENLATVLSLPLQGDAVVRSISIEAVGGEGLAGDATVDFSGATPVLTVGNSSTVTLDCGESGVQLSADAATVFNFILIPGEYTQGFKVTVNETNGNSTVKTTGGSAMTLHAGSIFKIKSALPVETPQGWNIYGTITGGEGTWIELQGGHGAYYCSNVFAAEGHNEFNIRYADDENQIFGIGYGDQQSTNVPELIPYGTYQGQDGVLNLAPSEIGYDIYFIEDSKKVIITETGTAAFSVIGNINNTPYDKDFPMVVENGWLVAKGIEFTGNIFKIRTTGKWNENGSFNIGAPNEGDEIAVGGSFKAWSHTETKNITVTGTEAGKKYDIYVDMKKHDPDNSTDNMTVWVMPSGQTPADVIAE